MDGEYSILTWINYLLFYQKPQCGTAPDLVTRRSVPKPVKVIPRVMLRRPALPDSKYVAHHPGQGAFEGTYVYTSYLKIICCFMLFPSFSGRKFDLLSIWDQCVYFALHAESSSFTWLTGHVQLLISCKELIFIPVKDKESKINGGTSTRHWCAHFTEELHPHGITLRPWEAISKSISLPHLLLLLSEIHRAVSR